MKVFRMLPEEVKNNGRKREDELEPAYNCGYQRKQSLGQLFQIILRF